MSPYHFHRIFKAATGLTPKAFHQAVLARRVAAALQSAQSVTAALYDAGFNSAGRFYEVLKYVSETRHIMLVNFEVISSKWFNALPPDYQKILVEECEKAGIETSKLIMDKLEKEVKQDLTTKRGMVVVDKVDLTAFKNHI